MADMYTSMFDPNNNIVPNVGGNPATTLPNFSMNNQQQAPNYSGVDMFNWGSGSALPQVNMNTAQAYQFDSNLDVAKGGSNIDVNNVLGKTDDTDTGANWFGEGGMANTAIAGASALATSWLGFENLGVAKDQYGLQKTAYNDQKTDYDESKVRRANALANS